MRVWLLGGLLALPVFALEPSEVALLVNLDEPAAMRVAEHYRQLRGVPDDNLFTIHLGTGETLPRLTYENELLPRLREWLHAPERNRIRCLLLIYGMPLRVAAVEPSEPQRAEAQSLAERLEAGRVTFEGLRQQVQELAGTDARNPAQEADLARLREELAGLERERGELDQQRRILLGVETQASLDSELALLGWPDYPLYRWVLNPLHFAVPGELRRGSPPVAMVARLDGPTPEIAMRLVSDAVAAERDGLRGKVYLDARGMAFTNGDDHWFGYSAFDESIRELAALLREKTDLEVVLDDTGELFAPGACPETMLYCGWYRVSHYLDAFDFVPGAVGYHIASFEARTLRGDADVWCKAMLEDGLAATLGPTDEPYLHAFPKPYEFFTTLLTGRLTIVECYALTAPLQSWMMTLIADPLYNPFGGRGRLSETDLRLSPRGAPHLLVSREGD